MEAPTSMQNFKEHSDSELPSYKEWHLRFGGTCCFHYQDDKKQWARNNVSITSNEARCEGMLIWHFSNRETSITDFSLRPCIPSAGSRPQLGHLYSIFSNRRFIRYNILGAIQDIVDHTRNKTKFTPSFSLTHWLFHSHVHSFPIALSHTHALSPLSFSYIYIYIYITLMDMLILFISWKINAPASGGDGHWIEDPGCPPGVSGPYPLSCVI
jgi:hypothetical protein